MTAVLPCLKASSVPEMVGPRFRTHASPADRSPCLKCWDLSGSECVQVRIPCGRTNQQFGQPTHPIISIAPGRGLGAFDDQIPIVICFWLLLLAQNGCGAAASAGSLLRVDSDQARNGSPI